MSDDELEQLVSGALKHPDTTMADEAIIELLAELIRLVGRLTYIAEERGA